MGIRDTKLVASTLQFASVPNTRSCLLCFPWTQKSSAPPAYLPRLHTQKRHNSEYFSSRSARTMILLHTQNEGTRRENHGWGSGTGHGSPFQNLFLYSKLAPIHHKVNRKDSHEPQSRLLKGEYIGDHIMGVL